MIELRQLNKYYKVGKQRFHALKDVDLTIGDGEMVAVVGKSGAGKSTLMNIIGLVDTWDSGEYLLDGVSIRKQSDRRLARLRNEKIGFVLQDFALIEDQSVLFNVSLPLILGREKYGNIKPKALRVLEKVGLADQRNKKANQLSGGQKQRVAIARTLTQKTPVIVFDDSLSAVDTETDESIRRNLSERVQGVTQILVSHRILTLLGCERVLVLEHGRVKQLGTPEELLQQEGLFREIYQAQMAVGEEEPA